jgi:uncharacterized protein (TIGR03067 family)
MGLQAALVMVLAVAVPAPPERADDSKRVAENLQGEWQMIRADFGAEPAPPDIKMGLPRMIIKGDQLIILPPGQQRKESDEATFTIDLDKKPYAIDIRPKLQKNEVVKGIFEFKDDVLHLTFGRPGLDRPMQFNPPPEARYVTLVFQRAAKK